jgi:hypothetical protein
MLSDALAETVTVPDTVAPTKGAEMDTAGAVVSMVHVKLAGVGSVLPAASVACTWKVWLPGVSAL